MKALSEQQVEDYKRDGYLFPMRALTAEEAAQGLANLSRAEAHIGSPLPKAEMKWRGAGYVFLPWVDEMVRHPRVLDIVEDVLGPDILVYWATFFIKDAGTPAFTAWHQDSTYFGLTPYEHVTAWIALSDASELAGCMEVVPGRGRARQMHHAAARLEHSINGAGQVIVEPIDASVTAVMALQAGEVSLHNTLCLHRSPPNRASHRRVGLGISYIPTHCKPTGTHRMYARLVRGTDRHGHFDLLPPPAAEFDPAAVDLHDRVYKRFRENYYEQEKMHYEQFGDPPAARSA